MPPATSDRPMSPFGARLAVATDGATARTLVGAMAVDATPTASERGGVLLGTAIADLTAGPTADDFNNLLAVLRAAGVIDSTSSTASTDTSGTSATTNEGTNV